LRFISQFPQFVDRQKHLPDLVWFGFASVVLDVDARIARPRSFEDGVAGAPLPWLAEKLDTNLVQISEPDTPRFAAHAFEDLLR
jgi:hypothetical protein